MTFLRVAMRFKSGLGTQIGSQRWAEGSTNLCSCARVPVGSLVIVCSLPLNVPIRKKVKLRTLITFIPL